MTARLAEQELRKVSIDFVKRKVTRDELVALFNQPVDEAVSVRYKYQVDVLHEHQGIVQSLGIMKHESDLRYLKLGAWYKTWGRPFYREFQVTIDDFDQWMGPWYGQNGYDYALSE